MQYTQGYLLMFSFPCFKLKQKYLKITEKYTRKRNEAFIFNSSSSVFIIPILFILDKKPMQTGISIKDFNMFYNFYLQSDQ